jgi:cytochrome c oxidase accessory protein FixG
MTHAGATAGMKPAAWPQSMPLEEIVRRVEAEMPPDPGVARSSAEAVNARHNRPLYESRPKIYPQRAHGRFRSIKWAVMGVTLGIYYLLPWLRWQRGPSLPDQAVLFDFANQRLYLFGFELWAQELYFVTGLLVLAALALFLVTAVAGRVWCGYACPQTVWTDLMIAVEHRWQGDRNARIRLDRQPWGWEKAWRKGGTHATWLLISLATGGAFVFYFRDAPTLAAEFASGEAPLIAWFFLGLFTATTYVLGGFAREQVCTYMCPWPRIQGAMLDRHSLLVSYRPARGEPGGPHRQGEDWQGRGDCIDCRQCVAVCPVGIDIRDGPQMECIQCALCIDACDAIMAKVGRPAGLIAYDTPAGLEAATQGARERLRLVRPRTMLYAALIGVVVLLMAVAWAGRESVEVNVLADRNPLFVQLSDGGIRNGFTLKILNKTYETRRFAIAAEGLPGAALTILGQEESLAPAADVAPDDLRPLRVFVSLPAEAAAELGEVTPFAFLVTDVAEGSQARRETLFRGPGR